MCDVATMQMIEEVVEDKVKAGKMFTAFDISLEVKKRGTGERHRHMKKVVHDYFCRGQMGTDYARTLIKIPGVKQQAYLYHLSSDDPNTYKPLKRASKVDDGAVRVDKRRRLCIPVDWLRSAGLRPGDSAYVVDDGGKSLVLSKKAPTATMTVVRTYKVEKDGNVRIAKAIFQKVGLLGQAYDIDGDNTKVMLRLHKTPKAKKSK